jgi:hypothetical protein
MDALNGRRFRGYAGAHLESAGRRDKSMAFLGLPTNRREAGVGGQKSVRALRRVLIRRSAILG